MRASDHNIKIKMKFLKISILFLLICMYSVSYAAPPNWNINPNDFEHSMTLTAIVLVDEAESANENDIVACFTGDECRGVAYLMYSNLVNRCLVQMTIFSNTTTQNDLTFKIYDAAADTVRNAVNVLYFESDANIGIPSSPYTISTTELPTSVWEHQNTNNRMNIKAYPNPASVYFIVEANETIQQYELRSYNAALIQTERVDNVQFSIDASSLPAGIYFLRCISDTSFYQTKIVIQ